MAMKIQIVKRSKEIAAELEEHTLERIQNTFGRFTHWVHGVMVRLADTNGPRGGADDKLVSIELTVGAATPLRFEGRSDTHEHALALALARAKRKLLASPSFGSRRPTRGRERPALA
jgi:hypothetical protein